MWLMSRSPSNIPLIKGSLMAKFKTDGVRKETLSTLVGSNAKSHGESKDVNSIMDV